MQTPDPQLAQVETHPATQPQVVYVSQATQASTQPAMQPQVVYVSQPAQVSTQPAGFRSSEVNNSWVWFIIGFFSWFGWIVGAVIGLRSKDPKAKVPGTFNLVFGIFGVIGVIIAIIVNTV